MTDVVYRAECVPPGHQAVLFRDDRRGAPAFRVIDRSGAVQAKTAALGVAITVARHLVEVDGEAWICASDGTTALLDRNEVGSDTPTRPWVRSVASAHHSKEKP